MTELDCSETRKNWGVDTQQRVRDKNDWRWIVIRFNTSSGGEILDFDLGESHFTTQWHMTDTFLHFTSLT